MSEYMDVRQKSPEYDTYADCGKSTQRAANSFLTNMSHDIKTPINAIIGYATLAAMNPEDKDKTEDYLNKIIVYGKHLLILVNDVLDMSSIESGKLHLDETRENIIDIFFDVKSVVMERIYANQLKLHMDIMDVREKNVYCDKARLYQVVMNVLTNAILFTNPGGRISVRLRQLYSESSDTGIYEIRIRDNGIGMSQEFVERIYEPFERERTTTDSKVSGIGLGLAITKNILDMMNGSIEVNTRQGKGTEVVITLPLKLAKNQTE